MEFTEEDIQLCYYQYILENYRQETGSITDEDFFKIWRKMTLTEKMELLRRARI